MVDNTECNGDGLDCSSEIRDQRKGWKLADVFPSPNI